MKFKKVNELIEFTVNSKLSYIKDGFVWYKNEEGILSQVTDNKEIEKLNKAENKLCFLKNPHYGLRNEEI